ncbi:hypothetical protein CYMTET_18373 [Cymbomonas tetramitiformis]|uniref:Uncharacterized protein n=1 Tax=Cymbomonas tetramitiformis TaxID=36881 RepID=A0AAE0G893_9CHLO|nr:hypothetical protein CYMTET_18373 [Cymbomonas tetramitiformis]
MGEVVNEEDPQYELVELEDLPEVAQILVTVLREKYEEYDREKGKRESARERFREQLAKRKLVLPGTQQTDGSGTEAAAAAPSAQASTEVDRYKYLLDSNLFEIDPDQHLGQVWVKPENKKNFPIMHVWAAL